MPSRRRSRSHAYRTPETSSCPAVTVARPPLEAEQAGLNVNGQRMAQAERQFLAPLSGVVREENCICVREQSFGHEPYALDEGLLVDSAVTCQLTPVAAADLSRVGLREADAHGKVGRMFRGIRQERVHVVERCQSGGLPVMQEGVVAGVRVRADGKPVEGDRIEKGVHVLISMQSRDLGLVRQLPVRQRPPGRQRGQRVDDGAGLDDVLHE